MLLAYLESFKYVGHLWPITILRFVMSWQYFRMAMNHIQSSYLQHPYLSEQLRLKMEGMGGLNSYLHFWEGQVQENWLLVSYVVVGSEILIAASYLLGYLVRPVSLWAAFLSIHLYLLVEAQGDLSQLFAFFIHLTFCLLGAGRCLGLDYYFYKSRRGLLW
jgi:thiosulfate dehydrogenase (quinone) large subunit